MANRFGCLPFLYLLANIACEPAPVADDTSSVSLHGVVDEVGPGRHIPPEADAQVREGSDQREGNAEHVAVDLDDSGDVLRGYVRFRIGEHQAVKRATLRLYITNGSTSSARIFKISASTWDERTIYWRNKPEIDGPQIAELGETVAGTWASIDVTSAIADGGVLSLALLARSEDGFAFASQEAASGRPYILLESENPPIASAGVVSPAPSSPLE